MRHLASFMAHLPVCVTALLLLLAVCSSDVQQSSDQDLEEDSLQHMQYVESSAEHPSTVTAKRPEDESHDLDSLPVKTAGLGRSSETGAGHSQESSSVDDSDEDSDCDDEEPVDGPSSRGPLPLHTKPGTFLYDEAQIERLLATYRNEQTLREDMDRRMTFNSSLLAMPPKYPVGPARGRKINISALLAPDLTVSSLDPDTAVFANLSNLFWTRRHPTGSSKGPSKPVKKKKVKRPMWRCYNGSGVIYGQVRLVNLTELGIFLRGLPCCDRPHCPSVAEQEAAKGNGSASNACVMSMRERFLYLVLNGSRCLAGQGDTDTSKSPIPINLNLLWASDFLHGDTGIGTSGVPTDNKNSSRNESESYERCQCTVLMIYSPACPFSVKLSPVYSALARQFPRLPFLATNADENSSVHFIYGVVGLPTVILLHKYKERYFARAFSDWQDLEKMGQFLTKFTGMAPLENITVVDSDYESGLPVEVEQRTDYMLVISSLYVVVLAWFLIVR